MRTVNRVLAPLVALALILGAVLLAVEVTAAGFDRQPVVVPWHGAYDAGRHNVWRSTGPVLLCIALLAVGLLLVAGQLSRRPVADRELEELAPGVRATVSSAALRRTLTAAATSVDGVAAARTSLGRRGGSVRATSRGADPSVAAGLTEPVRRAVDERLAAARLVDVPRISVAVAAGAER